MSTLPVHSQQSDAARANYTLLVQEIAWFALGFTATNRFLSVFAIRLGADETVLSLIAALPAFLLAISATFTLVWAERRTSFVKAIFVPSLIFRVVFLLPALAPLMPEHLRVPYILLSVALPGIGQGISNVLFIILLQGSVTKQDLPNLYSRRSLYFNIGLAVSSLAFGLWLEWAPFPLNYQLMYVLAFIFAMVSLAGVMRVKPLYDISLKPDRSPNRVRPWKSRSFRAVTLVMAVTFIAFSSVNALIPERLVNELHATEGYMAIFGLIELAAGAFISVLAPRLIQRFGYYGVIAIGMGATGISAFMLGSSGSLAVALVAGGISGMGWMLVGMVAVVGLYTDTIPLEGAAQYSVAYHQVYGMVLFLGPFVGALLAQLGLSMSAVLMIGAFLRIASGIIVSGMWLMQSGRAPRRLVSLVTRVF